MLVKHSLPAILAVGVVTLAGCSAGAPADKPQEAIDKNEATPLPKDLDCRGGVMSGTDGGLMPEGIKIKGKPSPEEAVEAFLPAISLAGVEYVVDFPDQAWVLRDDGTAIAQLNLLAGDGWAIHGYTRCDK